MIPTWFHGRPELPAASRLLGARPLLDGRAPVG